MPLSDYKVDDLGFDWSQSQLTSLLRCCSLSCCYCSAAAVVVVVAASVVVVVVVIVILPALGKILVFWHGQQHCLYLVRHCLVHLWFFVCTGGTHTHTRVRAHTHTD